MHIAWENGMLPFFLRRLPDHDRVIAECDASFDVPSDALGTLGKDTASSARMIWSRLIPCDGARATLSGVAAAFSGLVRPRRTSTTEGPMFFCDFGQVIGTLFIPQS